MEPIQEPAVEEVKKEEIQEEPVVETVTQEEVEGGVSEEITEVNTSNEEQPKTEKTEEDEPEYRRAGYATHTPCGDGVISQILEGNRAVVILFASEENVNITQLATGIFSFDSLSKPTYEKEPSGISILRGQVYRDFGDALFGANIHDKAVLLYQNAINLVMDVDEEYRVDSLIIVITCLCNMCTCFLSLGDVANAERMAKQAYEISPTFDKCAISMATVLVAQNKFEEAIKAIQPALKEKPDSQALIAIHNKIVEMINEEEKKKSQKRAQSSVLVNNMMKKSNQPPAMGVLEQMRSGAPAAPTAPAAPAAPAAKEESQEEDSSSMIWGVMGGALLLGLFLYKKFRK